MKKAGLLLSLILVFCANTSANSLCTSVIKADNLVQLISNASQYARIEGVVNDIEVTDKSKVIFLNFGANFNTSLSAIIYDSNIPDFIDAGINEPDKFFQHKKVVVEGIVRISNGKPEIIISSPSQIKVVDE